MGILVENGLMGVPEIDGKVMRVSFLRDIVGYIVSSRVSDCYLLNRDYMSLMAFDLVLRGGILEKGQPFVMGEGLRDILYGWLSTVGYKRVSKKVLTEAYHFLDTVLVSGEMGRSLYTCGWSYDKGALSGVVPSMSEYWSTDVDLGLRYLGNSDISLIGPCEGAIYDVCTNNFFESDRLFFEWYTGVIGYPIAGYGVWLLEFGQLSLLVSMLVRVGRSGGAGRFYGQLKELLRGGSVVLSLWVLKAAKQVLSESGDKGRRSFYGDILSLFEVGKERGYRFSGYSVDDEYEGILGGTFNEVYTLAKTYMVS